jgi:hypothetical protein
VILYFVIDIIAVIADHEGQISVCWIDIVYSGMLNMLKVSGQNSALWVRFTAQKVPT